MTDIAAVKQKLLEALALFDSPVVTPVPNPPPVVTVPSTRPDISLGVSQYAFSESVPRLMITGREGVTNAIRFEMKPDLHMVLLTVAETSLSGDTPTYEAWVSASPGGDPIGPVMRWQYTGGAIRVGGPGSPFFVQSRVERPGYYYFNVKNTFGAGAFYVQFNG